MINEEPRSLPLRPGGSAEDINVSYYIDLPCNSESHFFCFSQGWYGRGFPRLPFSIPRRLSTLRIIAREETREISFSWRGETVSIYRFSIPAVIFYERRPRGVQHALQQSSTLRARAGVRAGVCVSVCGFSNPWSATSIASSCFSPPSRPFLRQFHGTHEPEIRAIGFVSNQGGNQV